MKTYIMLANMGIQKTTAMIQSITDNSKFDEVKYDLCYHLIATIHLIGDIFGRKKFQEWENILSKEDAELLFAFAYINNQVKHDDALNMVYYEVCNSTFPLRFPMRFSMYPGVYWRDFKNKETRSQPLRPFYDSCLKEKDVLVTLEKLAELLARIENQAKP